MTKYWFKPKRYGYGATPANWKGWAATCAFTAFALLISLVLIIWPSAARTGPQSWQVALWLLMLIGSTVGFVRLSKAKTDGEWRWRVKGE